MLGTVLFPGNTPVNIDYDRLLTLRCGCANRVGVGRCVDCVERSYTEPILGTGRQTGSRISRYICVCREEIREIRTVCGNLDIKSLFVVRIVSPT